MFEQAEIRPKRTRKWGVLILLATLPTLLCCALPILLIGLGLGSIAALIYGEYLPFLGWFGLNKELTFIVTALILLFAGWLLFRSGRSCPSDPELAAACKRVDIINLRLFLVAVGLLVFSSISAYILPLFM